jgi:hypothetical protein
MADQIVASSSKALRDPSYVFRPPPLQVTAQDVYDRRAKGGQLVQAGLAETPFIFLLNSLLFLFFRFLDFLEFSKRLIILL